MSGSEESAHTHLIETLTARLDEMMNAKFNAMRAELRTGLHEEMQQFHPVPPPAAPPERRPDRRRELFPNTPGHGRQGQVNNPPTNREPVLFPEAPRQEYQQEIHEVSSVGDPADQSFLGDEAAADLYYSDYSRRGQPRRPHINQVHRPPPPLPADPISNLKLKIPPFHGKNDPTTYLEWEQKLELVFNCQYYSEINKINVAVTEFYDYALSWWDQMVTSRRRNGEHPIATWEELKHVMRRRFVPTHFHRDLHQRLRQLNQGGRGVEEYFQEMETLLIRAGVTEDREATMSRFMGGLNRDIQDRLELQYFIDLEEMLHKAILIEQQLKRRSYSRPSYGVGTAAKGTLKKPYNSTRPVDHKPSSSRPESNPAFTE